MKSIFYILAGIISISLFFQQQSEAQVPEKMSYQAVVRDINSNLIKESDIGMQISILRGSSTGIPVYVETHRPFSNTNGLITVEIGNGQVISGVFGSIDWSDGPYFLKTETDPTGGINYTISGTSQLLSVPFALHAKTAESVTNLILNGSETAFEGWDKNASDDFSGNYSDLQGKPTLISQYINDAGYLTDENDPNFNNSAASEISSTDISHLGNLSGRNSGDQDLSYLAKKVALVDSVARLRYEMQNISGYSGAETDPEFMAWNKSTGISISSSQISDLSFDVFEKELVDDENSIDVGFNLLATSIVFINGTLLPSSQWSGTGTQTLNVVISTKEFDKLKIKK